MGNLIFVFTRLFISSLAVTSIKIVTRRPLAEVVGLYVVALNPLRTLDGARPLRTLDGARPLRTLDGARPLRTLDGARSLRTLDGALVSHIKIAPLLLACSPPGDGVPCHCLVMVSHVIVW